MKIIVPYRNREDNLKTFLQHYNGFDIFIVEQSEKKAFNRAKLLNIGVIESKAKLFCLHDVDLIAFSLQKYREFKGGAEHYSGLCSQFNYIRPYHELFGGVTCFDIDTFRKCNGMSNKYWGWGGEDDDLYQRCLANGIKPILNDYKYLSLPHKKQTITNLYNENKKILSKAKSNYKYDGLDNCKYEIIEYSKGLNFEKIIVNL